MKAFSPSLASRLRRFTDKIQREELEAALVLLLLGIGVSVFTENSVIDSWGLFNPRKFGMMVFLLGAIEFSSYLAVKFFRTKKRAIILGFLGGLVSSTALILSASRSARATSSAWREWAVTIIFGIMASIVELGFIVGFVAPELLLRVFLVCSGVLTIGVIATCVLLQRQKPSDDTVEIRSPLNIWRVLRLSILLTVILAFVALAQNYAGDMGRDTAGFISGLFELHGVSFAASTMLVLGKISAAQALKTIELAVLASLTAKSAIICIIGKGNFRLVLVGILIAMGLTVPLLGSII